MKEIAAVHKHKMIVTRLLNPAVTLARRCPVRKIRDLASKAFGDSWYEKEMSVYENLDYQKVDLRTSIQRTEM